MIKIVAIGLWVCLVAFGSLMLGFKKNAPISETVAPKTEEALLFDRTSLLSVPILMEGKVQGYIISQLAFTLDVEAKSHINVPIDVFINDAIFSTFFTSYIDRRDFEKVSFADVKQKIIDDVNNKFPTPVLKDLLVEQFNFISVQEVRDMNNARRKQN